MIGMQFEISDEAAITFSDHLYGALVHGFPVDASVAQARRAIFAEGHDIEFGTPVLFLRGHDARLFEFQEPQAAEGTEARNSRGGAVEAETSAAPTAAAGEEQPDLPVPVEAERDGKPPQTPEPPPEPEPAAPSAPGSAAPPVATAPSPTWDTPADLEGAKAGGETSFSRPQAVTAASVLWTCFGAFLLLAGIFSSVDPLPGELASAFVTSFILCGIGAAFIVLAVFLQQGRTGARTGLTVMGSASLAVLFPAPLVVPALVLQYRPSSNAWFNVVQHGRRGQNTR